MKKILFSAAILFLFIKPVYASLTNLCNGSMQDPCIVQDTENNSDKVRHWRTTDMMAEVYQGNTTGLKNLWVSGAGATSAKGYKALAERIKKATNGKVKNMIVLDLRQESHAYLNNDAITLSEKHNWINVGKTRQKVLEAEQKWVQTLEQKEFVEDVLTQDQFKLELFSKGKDVSIEKILSEDKIAEKYGFKYERLTVSDHRGPDAENVDRFVDLVDSIPSTTWLHIHCRGGDGRSTTFLAMYDMLKNADKVSFTDILKRQAAVKPNYDLFQTERKNPLYAPYYKERLEFLMQFYQFASARLQGFSGNWTDWIKESLDDRHP